jgi:GT2 family glycosyltransferase
MELSIVVAAYNSGGAIEATIEAAERSIAHLNGEVIVVDNGSTDDTNAQARRVITRGRVVRLDPNIGYGRAINEGARRAQGDLLLIMNDDILLSRECVDRMIEAFRDETTTGMVGAKIVDRASHELPSFRRHLPGWRDEFDRLLSLILRRDIRHVLPANQEDAVDVGLVLAACALTSRELFCSLGGFNRIFFLYGEDIDFCRRLEQAGLRRRLVTNAVAIHDQEISPERRPRGRQFMERIVTARDNYYRIWLSRPSRMALNAYRAFGFSDQPSRFKFHASRVLTGGSSLASLRRPAPLTPTRD